MAILGGEHNRELKVRQLVDLPIPTFNIPDLEPFKQSLGRELLILHRDYGSIREGGGRHQDRQIAIQSKKGATRETQAKLEEGGGGFW